MRKKVKGTTSVPRLNVYRSLSHVYAQIIDDISGVTLVSASTQDKAVIAKLKGKTKTEASEVVGEAIAVKAKEKGINKVVFDRGGYIYTGRVKAVADGARKAGLEF